MSVNVAWFPDYGHLMAGIFCFVLRDKVRFVIVAPISIIIVTTPTQPQLNSKVVFDIKMTKHHHHH